jgi:PKD repeat protein
MLVPSAAFARPPVACFTQSPSSGVLTNQTVTFNSSCTSDPDNNISGRGWDLDNDGQYDDGTATSVTKSFSTPGTYTVRLGVIDSKNEYDVESQTVTVANRPPVAAFSISPAAPATGQSVTFTSTSTDPDGTVAAQAWDLDNDSVDDFNDGTGTTATKTFATAGTYTVKLQVTDNRGTTSISRQTVTVANRAPTANFTISPAAPNTGDPVTFTSTSTDPDGTIASQAWDLDNDSVDDFNDGTGTTASKTFATAGTYTVKLQVTDNNGAKHVASKTVNVGNRAPVAGFSISPAAPVSGQTITFTSTATDPDGSIAKVEWDLDGDAATTWAGVTGNTANTSFARPGSYTIRSRVTDNDGAMAIVAIPVTVANRSPVASFTIAPAKPVVGDPVTLTSTAKDPDGTVASQAWDLDNDGSYDDATGPTATFTPSLAGAFSVGLKVVDDSNAANTSTQTVVVGERPVDPPKDPGGGDTPPADPTPPSTQSFDISAPIVTTPSEPEPLAPALASPLRWLNPFPVVRLRGRTTARGVQLSLFTVRAPRDSQLLVTCKGKGCPTKRESVKITPPKGRAATTIHLKRFERFLLAGTDIDVAVTRKDMVGKYTRIRVRRVALPIRTDRCVLPGSARPVACPRTP